MREQLGRFRGFQRIYNEERPHQALGNDTPAEHYAPSPRRFDGVLREPQYGAEQIVRRVRHNGEIKWHGATIYINQALAGEPIGLLENDDGSWTVRYASVDLGIIDHRGDRLRKPKLSCGLVDNAKTRCPQGPQDQQKQT